MTSSIGIAKDPVFIEAYWRNFEHVLGTEAAAVKAVLIAKAKGRPGRETDVELVCIGLRDLLPWQAEAIERLTLRELGKEETTGSRRHES